MPRNNVSVDIDTKVLDRLLKQMPGSVSKNIRIVAFALEGRAKLKAPVDTGALRASIYTRTRKSGGGFSSSMIKGFAKITKKHANVGTREVTELPAPQGDEIAIVGPTVDYGIYVELGTRRMAARPFLGPATEHWRQNVNTGDMFRSLFK